MNLNTKIVFRSFGEPSSVLSVEEEPTLPLEAHEVLVKLKLAPINPSDLVPIRGAYRSRIQLPAIPGYEGLGTVVKQGTDVQDPMIGARVLPLRGEGTWQQYIRVPAEETIPVPPELEDDTACQLYINPLTIWLILHEEVKVKPGDTLVANAGGSAFCNLLARFSRIFNFDLIAITRSGFHTKKLYQSGASLVIDKTKEHPETIVRDFVKSKNGFVKAGLDAIGGTDTIELARCLSPESVLISYGLLSGTAIPATLFDTDLIGFPVTLKHYWLRNWVYNTDITYRKQIFHKLIETIKSHRINLPIARKFALNEILSAIKESEHPHKSGKVALKGID